MIVITVTRNSCLLHSRTTRTKPKSNWYTDIWTPLDVTYSVRHNTTRKARHREPFCEPTNTKGTTGFMRVVLHARIFWSLVFTLETLTCLVHYILCKLFV